MKTESSILYRDHRGGLKESMETVQTFHNMEQLRAHLENIFGHLESIAFKFTGHDKRTGWDNHYVLIKYKDIDRTMVVGMSNGILKKEL
jgi:hypothetical protein